MSSTRFQGLAVVAVLAGAAAAWAAPARYASPQAALDALYCAAKDSNPDALLRVLGPESETLVHSGDPVADRAALERFVRKYDEQRGVVESGRDQLTLEVGDDRWPLPIPLVKVGGRWQFDVEAGRDELISRRIGRNELATIESALAYTDAQREYYARNPEQSALRHYARRITSSEGKRDGLYWPARAGEPPSPLGELFAAAQRQGYVPKAGRSIPYHGYYYRILTAQGPHAEGGAYDYLAHGELLGGFALVAYPAEYGSSGVTTFIVNHDGVVFQKDLGPKTSSIAGSMSTFDPDPSWQRVEPAERPGA
jgi:hypothetical protein